MRIGRDSRSGEYDINLDPQTIKELLMFVASELSKKKRYVEAENILDKFETSDEKSKSVSYDLLARIRIKQKKYSEAKLIFQKAISFDPENMNPREALEYLPSYIRNIRLIKIIGVPVLLISLIAGVLLMFSPKRHAVATGSAESKKSISERVPGKDDNRAGLASVNIINSQNEWPLEYISGVSMKINNDEMQILFDKGIFLEKCDFNEKNMQLLRLLAEKMKSLKGLYIVMVQGHTDNLTILSDSEYRNNFDLGMMRAEKVASFFREECGLKDIKILPISTGAEDTPYSNIDEDSRRNNRTVSIRIIKAR